MLVRMPNMDLKFFVTAVAIQKQAGGDMAEILDKIGYIIREAASRSWARCKPSRVKDASAAWC